MGRGGISRRDVVTVGSAAVIALALCERSARAETMTPNISKAGSWVLGDKLSLAALGYGRGVKAETVDRLLSDAKSLAESLGVAVKPFPPKASKESETLATMIHYLIKGDGWSTGTALINKYDKAHGVLFEVSVKSNLLLLLYAPGDDSGIGSIIKSRFEEIKLPPTLWSGVVALIDKKAPSSEVSDAVFKMHKDVTDYFIKG